MSLEERHGHLAEMEPVVTRVDEVRRVDAVEGDESVGNGADECVDAQ